MPEIEILVGVEVEVPGVKMRVVELLMVPEIEIVVVLDRQMLHLHPQDVINYKEQKQLERLRDDQQIDLEQKVWQGEDLDGLESL